MCHLEIVWSEIPQKILIMLLHSLSNYCLMPQQMWDCCLHLNVHLVYADVSRIQTESSMVPSLSAMFTSVPVDDSPVPSPPASPDCSYSQSPSTEIQGSQNEFSFSTAMLDNPASPPKSDIPEPFPTNDILSSSSPPNSSPARIFSSSPFASSQPSLLASDPDEPEKVNTCASSIVLL